MNVNIFWFRRDLRLNDNTALENALAQHLPVLTVFIFDTDITEELARDDARISFIHETLSEINSKLRTLNSSVLVLQGKPEIVWKNLLASYNINSVFINKDYEPYAISRDENIEKLLAGSNIPLLKYKDQVIFEESEILKPEHTPYTVFTPYKNRWLRDLIPITSKEKQHKSGYYKIDSIFPSLNDLGFKESKIRVMPYDLSVIRNYDKLRDFPALDCTTHLSPHLRFGTVSIRKIVKQAFNENQVFLSELIWREFFMQILFSYPEVVTSNFRSKYNGIEWRNNDQEFEKWCIGETGYPLVDAGMRQMNQTGYMHNRVRMIVAGFLTKHLLTDWRRGEAYFAEKLLDYELSSNNGNWQWAAGTGCDAAPYFRIFNPDTQLQKFDQKKEYVRRWIPELDQPGYPPPIVDHDFARRRALEAYQSALR